jgi:hypothetical protein
MGRCEPAFPWAAPEDIPEEIAYVDDGLRQREGASFTYLDCGVWTGDGRSSPLRRSFAVVCGRSVALCEFRSGEPFGDLEGGAPEETAAINEVLRAVAGHQRLDVQVIRFTRAGARHPVERKPVYVLLPDLQLPLATRMPDLDPNLVPDPRAAGCLCCGPILQRILYGQKSDSEYRAIGCNLGRDPNGWFVGMTEHFYESAADLVTFLGRLHKLSRARSLHLVQLGELFEVWAGYGCCFQASGRAAIVVPRVVRGIGLRELLDYWRTVTIDDPIKRALDAFSRFPAGSRTVLHCERDPGPNVAAALRDESPTRELDIPEVLFAERPDRAIVDEPPIGLFALLEQRATFLPWRRQLDPDRARLLSASVECWLSRAADGAPFPIYATAQSHVPCLTNIVLRAA